MAHEEGERAAHEGGEEGATGRCEGTLIENVGYARQWEELPATRTSTHRQGQNCTAFKAKINCLNLTWKENKREDLNKRGVSGILEMGCVLFP